MPHVFQPGDIVRVNENAKEICEKIKNFFWASPAMDNMIGKEFKVSEISWKTNNLLLGKPIGWYFPPAAVTLVRRAGKHPQPETPISDQKPDRDKIGLWAAIILSGMEGNPNLRPLDDYTDIALEKAKKLYDKIYNK